MKRSHTISDAVRLQSDLQLGHLHVAYISDDGFVLAHTSTERLTHMDLRACEIHQWLKMDENSPYGNLDCCFPDEGWYKIATLHDVAGLAL